MPILNGTVLISKTFPLEKLIAESSTCILFPDLIIILSMVIILPLLGLMVVR
jgi:hypothetical protein